MSLYPGARWRPVHRYQPGVSGSLATPMDRYDAGVDHTFVGDVSSDRAFSHFNTPGEATPHFMFNEDGTVDQYIDTKYRSSAVLDGNPRCITWETWDGYPGEWQGGNAPADNAAIVEAKAALMVWLYREHGIPLVQLKSTKPGERGMGWHRLGIDGNFPDGLLGGRVSGGEHWSKSVGKTCPTDRRIRQFVDETLPRAVALDAADKPKPTLLPVHHRIATANLFVKNRDQSGGLARMVARVTKPLGWKPDAIGVQEGRYVEVQGYQTLVDKTDGEASHEIPVLLRDRLKVIGTEYHRAADGIGADGVLAHPRGIFVVKYRKRGRKCALVNTHMGVFGEPRATEGRPGPAADQHAAHAQKVVATVERLRRNGYVVHVTADANSRGRWVESLPAVLAEVGMTVTRHGIDIIASDPKRVRSSVVQAIVPKAVTGSDAHDGIAIRTTEKRKP